MNGALKLHLGLILVGNTLVYADHVVSDQILSPITKMKHLPENQMRRVHFIYYIPVDDYSMKYLESRALDNLGYSGRIKSISEVNELHIYDSVRNVKKIIKELNKLLFLN